jgi:hypothetical protein
MKTRSWLIVNCGYFGLLGAGYVVAPGTMLQLFYSPQAGEVAPYVARLAGTLGIALFALVWAIRGTRDAVVLRSALGGLLFVDLVNLAMTVAGALSGVGPAALWWLAAAVIAALAIGAAYSLFRTRSMPA